MQFKQKLNNSNNVLFTFICWQPFYQYPSGENRRKPLSTLVNRSALCTQNGAKIPHMECNLPRFLSNFGQIYPTT